MSSLCEVGEIYYVYEQLVFVPRNLIFKFPSVIVNTSIKNHVSK